MTIFDGLDSPTNISSAASTSGIDLAQPDLTYLANAGKDKIETKLGLNDSGRIALEIINIARRAKRHRKDCTYIADQAYQLVNAVDGGVKGRAIDVNNILQDHVTRLNEDLEQIRKIVKDFASWWILFRSWSAPRGLQKCHDILNHGMDMYLLLLRCSLNQPAAHLSGHQRHASADYHRPAQQPAKKNRRNTHPLPPSPSVSQPDRAGGPF